MLYSKDSLGNAGERRDSREDSFPDSRTFGSDSDLIIVPAGSIYFHLHSNVLLRASTNFFNYMLPISPSDDITYFGSEPMLSVPECSDVFNVVVHAIYGMSCAHYDPSFDTLAEAVSAMKVYGVIPNTVITPSSPLYDLLMTYASTRAIDIYALAAQNNLHDLAVASSSYLLSFSLSSLSDEMAERMGPIYLKRLFFMHLGRAEALRNLLFPPPYPHPPTATCDREQQTSMTRAWALAAAYLAWDPEVGVFYVLFMIHKFEPHHSIDVSVDAINTALVPLGDHISCDICQATLRQRIDLLVARWSSTKVRHSHLVQLHTLIPDQRSI